MHNTTNYINVLQKLVFNYNHSYHSGIKKIPAEVKNEDGHTLTLARDKYIKAKSEEVKFFVGDKVRFMLNIKAFEKRRIQNCLKVCIQLLKLINTVINLIMAKHTNIMSCKESIMYKKLDQPGVGPTRQEMTK